MGKIAILLCGLWLITACTVTPAHVDVTPPRVVAPAVIYESPPPAVIYRPYPPARPRHCPPGHAKKGWC